MSAPISSRRDHAMTTAVTLVTSLLRCVLWLIKHGVFVTGFRGTKSLGGVDRVTVTVAESPYLYELFRSNCFWLKRIQRGNIAVFTWQATRWGIVIEWEQTCAHPNF